MEKLPLLSVFEFRETLPEIDVAVTVTPWTGRLSGPVTLPRMTSVVWADRSRPMIEATTTAMRDSRRRTFTAPLLGGTGACGGPSTFHLGLDKSTYGGPVRAV